MSDPLSEYRELRAQGEQACPLCESASSSSGRCFVQPCGAHCKYPYTDERPPVCDNCANKARAKEHLAALHERTYEALLEAVEKIRSGEIPEAVKQQEDWVAAAYYESVAAVALALVAKEMKEALP